MQIIIDLYAPDEGIIHSNDKVKMDWRRLYLLRLLQHLEHDGYVIHTLTAFFVFDQEKKEVIDVGKPGELCPSSLGLVDVIFKNEGKMAVIFTDQKYIVFSNRYFAAIHFCHMRRVKPLSIYDVYKWYKELIEDKNQKLLEELYLKKFEFMYGKDAKAMSYIKGDNELKTSGIVFPGPVIKKD